MCKVKETMIDSAIEMSRNEETATVSPWIVEKLAFRPVGGGRELAAAEIGPWRVLVSRTIGAADHYNVWIRHGPGRSEILAGLDEADVNQVLADLSRREGGS